MFLVRQGHMTKNTTVVVVTLIALITFNFTKPKVLHTSGNDNDDRIGRVMAHYLAFVILQSTSTCQNLMRKRRNSNITNLN